jgi:outer membrane protein TolC
MRERASILLLVAAAATARAETRRLTVEDVMALGLRQHPQAVEARAREAAGRDGARSAVGRMLPWVHLAEDYQHWDSPFRFPNGLFPGITIPPNAPPIRDQDTNTFVASAGQPLLGLLRLSQSYLAERGDAEAAAAGRRAVEDDLRAQLQIGDLRYFEARTLEQIALASAGQLDEQVQVTQAKVNAGVLTTADLLRVRVAADNARQQAIVARTQAEVARAELLAAVGLHPDDTVELVEPTALLEPAPAPGDAAEALRLRPEIARARAGVASAVHRREERTLALLPDIDLAGAYQRLDGQIFAPHDSAFVGVHAQWAIWESGASWWQRQQAAHLADAARAQLDGQERRVRVEVAARRAELSSASSAVKLAEETIVSAEEAYRVMNALVRAGTATTTDLLDAQAALTQARLNRARARYEEAIARITLARAVGR